MVTAAFMLFDLDTCTRSVCVKTYIQETTSPNKKCVFISR